MDIAACIAPLRIIYDFIVDRGIGLVPFQLLAVLEQPVGVCIQIQKGALLSLLLMTVFDTSLAWSPFSASSETETFGFFWLPNV